MTANIAEQVFEARVGETINPAVDIKGLLPIDDTGASTQQATGTPTIIEVNTTDLTVANKAVSIATLYIEGVNRVAGEAIQFTASGFLTGVTYNIKITFATTGSQTRVCGCVIQTVE